MTMAHYCFAATMLLAQTCLRFGWGLLVILAALRALFD
jgi:hypothetical protein